MRKESIFQADVQGTLSRIFQSIRLLDFLRSVVLLGSYKEPDEPKDFQQLDPNDKDLVMFYITDLRLEKRKD